MVTLILDTSMGIASAILVKDRVVVAASSESGSTLSLIHKEISRVESNSRIAIGEFDEIAVVQGPGSWTGLHNGVTTAKTIAQVLDVPLIPLSMLDVMAMEHRHYDGFVCSVIDAKHEAVYSGVYKGFVGKLEAVAAAKKRTMSELASDLADLAGPVLLVGNGTAVVRRSDIFASWTDLEFAEAVYPSAESFVALTESARGAELVGDARFSLAPDYMQEDFTAVLPRSRSLG